ncbi:MAG: hypothetical protein COW27_04180 [Nitrosopumilales archaeon CG15_BIG_FIL_POST_REV_8_21_14_020_37_12]|nr:MAG: hypothetical protein COW27_04180 [Nitrosopumilales archaeon CG15_BIG_FIL_POST_REV_8_21_14_020_37_12]
MLLLEQIFNLNLEPGTKRFLIANLAAQKGVQPSQQQESEMRTLVLKVTFETRADARHQKHQL